MAFNVAYFKGTTSQQARNSLDYWMNALQPAEDVERMKEEKANEIAENAVQLQRIQECEPEPSNLHELSEQ